MNIPPEDYNKYFEILELGYNAPLSEVRSSYLRLRALYSSDSIVTSAIIYEFPDDSKQAILDQIDEAYAKLREFFKDKEADHGYKERPSVAGSDIEEYLANVTAFSGPALKMIRERLVVELKDIANFTKIRRQYFEDIELERFEALPTEVYLRGYVVEYARYLSLDPARVAGDYMARYRTWKTTRGNRS
ncbi:MAG: helix-turn-helix domain-containing protein [Nitrospirae bacterium]|nr:MAG: helix-turn-helix domain-containing protein [Nitrospirota bacterium]